MTTGRPEADRPREDALVSRLYQEATEEQAARFAAGYDLAAGLARYRAWLGEHTTTEQTGAQAIPAAAPAQPPPAPPGASARLRGRAPSPRRRRASWLAPVMAAAAVVAIALTLVIVRDMPDGPPQPPTSSAPASPTAPVAPIAGVPQYYVTPGQPAPGTDSWKLVIGDTFTGRRLATIAPPHGTSWGSMTGAADDRTFVVSNTPAGDFSAQGVPVTWYLLRITPGEKPGYQLTRLAIPVMKPWCIEAIGLSGSGKELAMTLVPVPTTSNPNPALWVLRTYSVATGKPLGNWSVKGTTSLAAGITVPGIESPTLKWVNGDRAVAFYAYDGMSSTGPATPESVRLLNVTGGSGNLIADSTFILSIKAPSARGFIGAAPPAGSCVWNGAGSALPQVTTDGKTVVCITASIGAKQGRSRVTFEWLAYSAGAQKPPHILYKVAVDALLGPDTTSSVLWSGPSGGPMIIEWATETVPPSKNQNGQWDTHFGVVSHGQFHPLPLPANLTPGSFGNGLPIAW